LKSIGVDAKEVPKLLKNKKVLARIMAAVDAAKIPESGCAPAVGTLIVKLSGTELPAPEKIAELIGAGKIQTQEQLAAAMEFVQKNKDFTQEQLEKESGVGVVVSEEEIKEAAKKTIENSLDFIAQKGKKAALGEMMKRVKVATETMKFAPSKVVIAAVKAALDAVDESKLAKPAAAEKKPAAEKKKQAQEKKEDEAPEIDFKGIVASFPTPADNAMGNSPEVQKEHMEITGGCFMTRFPPEPNGWIHIGHAKAMMLDFGLAMSKGGKCYMRFDDTNPAKEKDEFIEGIGKDVHWLGFDWWKLTHTSDYFHKLYEFALKLIDEGLAYVDHQTKDEIKEYREKCLPSPWRDRDPKESRREFELMRLGFYEPSEATLRLKMDYKNVNPNMRDQIAYRIIYKPHPRTNDEWCIYPTYDYSHCVIDSLEHVTHSLCTLEFENRRDSYYWVLDALKIYKPIVWEFSRLNLTHTIMSKRRLQALVYEHHVAGWDDPRMPTIAGMRRRGYTANAIRQFCQGVGYTRNVTTLIKVDRLESIQRADLDENSPRAFCVEEPLKVTLQNLPESKKVTAAKFPKKPELGDREMTLSKTIYIEKSDFMENPSKGFKRLTPTSVIGLKYANIRMKVAQIIKNEAGEVTELICDVTEEPTKTFIHWVSEGAIKAELRIYGDLFDCIDVSTVEGDWRDALSKKSLRVINDALVEPSLATVKPQDRFQFERDGYFCCDDDSKPEHIIFNLTLPLAARPPE
jgi:glutaminyl-tRNA synthetase